MFMFTKPSEGQWLADNVNSVVFGWNQGGNDEVDATANFVLFVLCMGDVGTG
jgi:hypothetical protein